MSGRAAVLKSVKRPPSKGGVPRDMWVRVPPAASVRLPEEVQRVHALAEAGLSLRAIERETGISRATARHWLQTDRHLRCPACGRLPHDFSTLPPRTYAYLLGLYLGDGTISKAAKCLVMNRVWHGKYTYPRYFFANHSLDIQRLFREAADIIGIEYANNRWHTISVARHASGALLDEIVGPKTRQRRRAPRRTPRAAAR